LKLIIDADFGLMNDDAWATLLALKDPRAEVLGVTVVAGNFDVSSEYRNATEVLSRAGYPEVPVLMGASTPLVHVRGPCEDRVWGGWDRDRAERAREGTPQPGAVEFILEQARAHPGEVSVLAIGPLTNLALALREEPALPHLLDRIVVMGGSIDGLPHGGGNVTPSAEFNIWVDPEAARAVFRSGARLLLVPLNATRLAKFTEADLERIVAAPGPIADLFREHILPAYAQPPGTYHRESLYEYALCDPLTLACLMEPDVCTTKMMFVEVEIGSVLAYGTTYGYVIGEQAPPEMPHPERVEWMKRKHLQAPNAWAWTGLILPDHPPYWTTPPAELEVVVDVDVEAFRRWFLDTLTS